jgi:mRNA interferase MazF
LPEGLRTRGVVLVDQVRTIDRAARLFRIIERAPTDFLAEVMIVLISLLGLRPSRLELLR